MHCSTDEFPGMGRLELTSAALATTVYAGAWANTAGAL